MATAYENILRSVESLSRTDQLRLISELADYLRKHTEPETRTSILELQGLGKRDLAGDWRARVCRSRARLMEWIKSLRGSVVGLDTAPLIYLIEENFRTVRSFFEAADQGKFQIVTSMLTLTEVLVHPLLRRDRELVAGTAEYCSMPVT
jgi:hypothetical protein